MSFLTWMMRESATRAQKYAARQSKSKPDHMVTSLLTLAMRGRDWPQPVAWPCFFSTAHLLWGGCKLLALC